MCLGYVLRFQNKSMMNLERKLKNLKWQNVAVEDYPVTADNLNGFLGLEECRDYGFDFEPKQPKKKNSQKKRKLPVKSIKSHDENSKKKKVELCNGFTVETCVNVSPSLTNEADLESGDSKTIQDQKPKRKTGGKHKIKLGEKSISENGLTIEDMGAWSHFQIPEEILKALADQNFKSPTKIQELTLPSAILGRRDILGAAETGSGKTLAFGIPILTGIMKLKEKHLAGVDVYELPYKKSSVKKKNVQVPIEKDKKPKIGTNKKKSTKEISDEDGYSSGSSENSFIEEIEVPIKKKVDRETDEGNDSDDSDDYVHLSEMFDSDDAAETDDDESNYEYNTKENEDKEGSEDENEMSLDEYASEDDGSNHIEGLNDSQDTTNESGIGCVKVIDDIEMPPHLIPKTGKPLYALILTPTRELAIQVSRHLIAAAKYTGIKIATLVGGMAHVKQERILSRGPEVVVATPGRLWELIQQGQRHLQQLENIKFLAIDETDRMVEKNHFEELHPLLEKLNSDEARKSSRQNFVFSATLTLVHDLPAYLKVKKVTKRGKILNKKIEKMTPQQKVKKLVDMIGMTDPKVVDITAHNSGTAETLTECRIACALDQKDHYLYYVLKRHPGRAIVFCNSIGSVKRLAQLFGLLKCHPLPLHASMPQRQRLKNLERFRDDPHGVLIATDVAARGLDIPDVDHVIHYQVPRTAENYVHRSGRTARASKEGLTILMMEPGEAYLYAKLCRTLNKKSELPIFPVPGHVLSSMREVVSLAREVDKLQLQHRRTAQEQGWIDKAAQDMDLLVDEDFLPRKTKDDVVGKKLQLKKKQLETLMDKPMFPRGFSFKYPTLNDPDALLPKVEENALQVMKNALQSGELKKQKRKSKNAPLLNLEKQMKHKNKFN